MASPRLQKALRSITAAGGVLVVITPLVRDYFFTGAISLGPFQAMLQIVGLVMVLASATSFKWSTRLLLLCGSVALVAVCFEVTLRLVFADKNTTIYREDEAVLYSLRAGARKVFVGAPISGSDGVIVAVNEEGYRGEPLAPRGSALRVVVFGDSNVEAEFSELRATFVNQLAGELQKSLHRPVEGVNAGVVGYGPDQELLRMERELPLLDPALAVAVLFADNDFGDLVRNGIFVLDERGNLLQRRSRLGPSTKKYIDVGTGGMALTKLLYKGWDQLQYRVQASGPGGWLDGNARASISSEDGLKMCHDEVREMNSAGDTAVTESALKDHYDYDVALQPSSESARYKMRLMDKVIGRMAAAAEEARVPLLLVLLAAKVDICELCSAAPFEAADLRKYPEYRRSNIVDALARSAEAAGLPYVNLFDSYRDTGADKLYFVDDGHWNDEGQALAARLVAARVVETGWLSTQLATRASMVRDVEEDGVRRRKTKRVRGLR